MKTTMSNKVFSLAVLHLAFSMLYSTAQAADVEQVIVRQQWPWSTDIKVEYRLSGVDASHPVDISVTAYNGDTPLDSSRIPASIRGAVYGVTDEIGEFYIDPVAAFGTEKLAFSKFKVNLSIAPMSETMGEVLYKIFCLTNNTCVNVRRADLLNGTYGAIETDFGNIGSEFRTSLDDVIIWTDVTNNPAYKTTHLVMRKVPAKDVVWKIGSPSSESNREWAPYHNSETQHDVKLTQNYYIGVFEVTQNQYERICGSNPSPAPYSGFADSAYHPVNNVSYADIRGGTSNVANGENVNWPTNSYKHLVYGESLCGKMRTKFGIDFDIPTEAQWEFACRAGTTAPLYSGFANSSDNVEPLAWYKGNVSISGIYRYTHAVGAKKPNAFGLYDMLGNVIECCLDWVTDNIDVNGTGDPLVEPEGPVADSSRRMFRGGSVFNDYDSRCCRSADRSHSFVTSDTSKKYYAGVRLVCPVGSTWED